MAYEYRTSFTAAAQADREETIVDGRFSSSGDIALADGTATQGAIYFADDKNTGIYSPSNNQIAFTTDGSANVILGGSALVHIKAGSQHWSQGLLLEDSAGGDGWNFYPDPDSGGEFFIGYNDDVVGSPNTSTTVFKLKGSDKSATFSGNVSTGETLTVTGANPNITFVDSDNNPDYKIYASNAVLTVLDSTNSVNALTLNKDAATFAGTVTCTSLTETSDIALKTNIEPITNVLDKINQLTGYKYDFTASDESSMGVIAQDVEKVFPELVHGEEGSKSLQYSGLIGALIESVKELSAKVAALESGS